MKISSVSNAVLAGVGASVALGKRAYYGYQYQPDLIDELRDQHEYLLIILDACRYDVFQEIAPELLEYTCEPVWSSGRNTFEYVRKAWPDEYPNVTYLSVAPPVNSNSREEESPAALDMFRGYIASEHISDIREMFKQDTAENIGTCPPEIVTKEAIEVQSSKMVAHYFQPHAPYIGEKRIVMEGPDGESNTKLIWDAVRDDELDIETVRQAYRANLKRVLHSVANLIDSVEYETIVVTSDHGEALGEYQVLSHPDEIPYHPKTRIVPWTRIGSVKEYNEWTVETSGQTEKTVESRLSQLGYL